jgi:hypothetical protein
MYIPLSAAWARGTARQCLLAMRDHEVVQAGTSPWQVLESAGRSGAACRRDASMAARCPTVGNQHAQCIRTAGHPWTVSSKVVEPASSWSLGRASHTRHQLDFALACINTIP